MSRTLDLRAQTRDVVDPLLRPSTPAVRAAADDAVPTHTGAGLGDPPLGALSAAVARLAADYGRRPTRAASWRLSDNCVVTVLEDFLTPGEQALVERGGEELVRQLRSAFVAAISDEYLRAVEGALGREVSGHRSELICPPRVCVEIFMLANERGHPNAKPSSLGVPEPHHSPG